MYIPRMGRISLNFKEGLRIMRSIRWYLNAVAAAGVITMSCASGYAQEITYEHYSGSDPLLNITAEYPAGWTVNESRGTYENYTQVVYAEPQRGDKNIKAGMTVTVEDAAKIQLKVLTASGLADDITARRRKFKDFKDLGRKEGKLMGSDAVIMEFAYATPDRLHAMNMQIVPVREKAVVFRKDATFYTVRYMNTEAEFARYLPAFEHFLQTLQLKAS